MHFDVMLGDHFRKEIDIDNPTTLEGWGNPLPMAYWIMGLALQGDRMKGHRSDTCRGGEGGYWEGTMDGGTPFFIQDTDFPYDERFINAVKLYGWKDRSITREYDARGLRVPAGGGGAGGLRVEVMGAGGAGGGGGGVGEIVGRNVANAVNLDEAALLRALDQVNAAPAAEVQGGWVAPPPAVRRWVYANVPPQPPAIQHQIEEQPLIEDAPND